jgi:prolycopene isomerase
MKAEEAGRMLSLVERRFPGFGSGLVFSELGSPATIERYLLKNGGSVAGPKQSMGQELMKRQHAATCIPGLFACGESTVMGTGTPAVTISGISAADRVLRELGLPEYRNHPAAREFVRIIPKGQAGNRPREACLPAAKCLWCEEPPCALACPAGIDVKGIMRRLEAGNEDGAARRLAEAAGGADACAGCAAKPCLSACARRGVDGEALPIPSLLGWLRSGR